MMFKINAMKKLTDIANDISTTLNKVGYDLIKEDKESLYTLLGSEQFLEDFNDKDITTEINSKSYFLISFLQTKRRLKERKDKLFQFKDLLQKTKDKNIKDNTIDFLEQNEIISFIVHICDYFTDQKFIEKLPGQNSNGKYKYFYEIIEKIQNSDRKSKYFLSHHIGNLSLFKTSICRKNIEHKNKVNQSVMTLDDYKKFGLTYYKKASKHEKAEEEGMKTTLQKVSNNFDVVRSTIDLVFEDFGN